MLLPHEFAVRTSCITANQRSQSESSHDLGCFSQGHQKRRQPRNVGMKVSNTQKSDKTDDGVSRDTLNDWQRKDAAKSTGKAKHAEAGPKDAGKQAEG